jgi:hypothetical protein
LGAESIDRAGSSPRASGDHRRDQALPAASTDARLPGERAASLVNLTSVLAGVPRISRRLAL